MSVKIDQSGEANCVGIIEDAVRVAFHSGPDRHDPIAADSDGSGESIPGRADDGLHVKAGCSLPSGAETAT
jgi:hypothetical protein